MMKSLYFVKGGPAANPTAGLQPQPLKQSRQQALSPGLLLLWTAVKTKKQHSPCSLSEIPLEHLHHVPVYNTFLVL